MSKLTTCIIWRLQDIECTCNNVYQISIFCLWKIKVVLPYC